MNDKPVRSIATRVAAGAAGMAIVATLAFAGPALADWPIYGHDLSNTRSAGSEGPSTAQVASMPKAWTFTSSHGDFTATPVVAGGVLVAGTNMGTIFGIDAVTGKQLWSRDVGQMIDATAAIDLNAPGGATVFVPIAQEGNPRLLALWLKDGSVRWDTPLSRQAASTNPDIYGSPTFWKGSVYIGTSGPNFDVSTARGSVVALNESSGKVRWLTYTVPPGHDGGAVWSTPAIDTATGRLYVGTGNAYHDPVADTTDSIMALDASSGRILGHYQATANDVFNASDSPVGVDADFGASPNLFVDQAGRSLVGEGSKNGTYYALDRSTMKPVWSTSVGPGSSTGGVLGSTAYDGGQIYGSIALDSQVWAIGRDGSQSWGSADAGPFDFSPVAVSNGVLYTNDFAGFLTARDASSGTILGKFPLANSNFAGTSIVGRAVYVAVGTGPFNAMPGGPGSSTGSIVAFGDTGQGASGGASATTSPSVAGSLLH